jgi:ATP-dependent Clp protease protease subunit
MKKFLLFLWLFLISNTITNSEKQNVQMVHGNLEDEVIHSVMEKITKANDNNIIKNKKQIIPIVGVINDDLIHYVVELIKETDEDIVFYFDTPGGSVTSGMKLLPYLQNTDSVCVVQSAYSMGFVLFQACSNRYMLPYGSLMQHDMHLGVRDDFHRIRSYLRYLERVYDKLIKLQIERIGISRQKFIQRILKNWWMTAEEAVEENCADAIVQSVQSIQ